uniref:Rad52/22 domaincontaining protein putative n=1 Tax=Albugo laibachii Nc14 TaxID=890382 RepID=F0W0T5_9STRA|nr:Rad52/22 domaincontaining protein putative [Albugo laibachii Nc14]|eukprot:CCA14659.1 Rad52/22 domaincontaining protein putative [Albugo laibachii Nc14]
MKRKLSDINPQDATAQSGPRITQEHTTMANINAIADSIDLQSSFLAQVSKHVADSLLSSFIRPSLFGTTSFDEKDQSKTEQMLHQKLGKENLSRRPGPRGTRLTYIESCKAIELANHTFGFNGWSCHLVECKEEYREKKQEKWSIAFSSLVRIELKDGTSHEDVGFGQADGQRDLGAALEQAKKASISDARKRALRLFGEYLGNSCYDKEHVRDALSEKPTRANLPASNTSSYPSPNNGVIGDGQPYSAASNAPNVPIRSPSGSSPTTHQVSRPLNQHEQQKRTAVPPLYPKSGAGIHLDENATAQRAKHWQKPSQNVIKTEPTVYDMNDISLSQFDYNPADQGNSHIHST